MTGTVTEEDEAAITPPEPPDPRRVRYVALLIALAELLAANPWLAQPYMSSDGSLQFCIFDEDGPEHVAAARRLIGGTWAKSTSEDGDYLRFLGSWHGFHVEISMLRAAVCRKVVTTEMREVEKVVRRASVRRVMEPVKVTTWECGSLLALAADETPQVTA